MIRIVDYGVGNIQSFLTMYKRLDLPAERARTPAELTDATRLILPGVGAFDHAIDMLNSSGMRETFEGMVLGQKIPVLGVCVGMQMLAAGSDEGVLSGLNWIPGRVREFAVNQEAAPLPLPHMGWNDLVVKSESKLLADIETIPRFYFLHSYYFDCDDRSHVAATTEYGLQFDCVVSSDNIHGVQFHPEKSHHFGAQLLKNFAEL
jgi:glutamine amidotransferase